MDILKRYTIKSLLKNKTRTIVTIVGIILSVAMFTATTEALFVAEDYFNRILYDASGSFHVGFYGIEEDDFSFVTEDERVNDFAYLQDIGYAEFESLNERKPYIYVAGMSPNFPEIMPLHLTMGRFPENGGEIVLPEHLYTDAGFKANLGEKITLGVGERKRIKFSDNSETEFTVVDDEGWEELTIAHSLYDSPFTLHTEAIVNKESKTYTVVGFCSELSSSIEPLASPAYVAFTVNDEGSTKDRSIYTILKNPKEYENYSDYVRFTLDVNSVNNFDYIPEYVFVGIILLGILALFPVFLIIAAASVCLIYSSFAISVSDRTKQFGILKSVGATKSQIRKTVLFEAMIFSLAAIPPGLIAGCAGTYLIVNLINKMLVGDIEPLMRFVFSPAALLTASIISIATVLLAALLPAIKTTRISAIESVRLTKEIKTDRKSAKSSILNGRLFGFEAELSSRYYRRNRKKYRITVFSLIVSVVLFVVTSFIVTDWINMMEFESHIDMSDVSVSIYGPESDQLTDEFYSDLFDGLNSISSIDDFSVRTYSFDYFFVDEKYASDDYLQMIEAEEEEDTEKAQDPRRFFMIYCIDDDSFRSLLTAEGLDEKDYFNKENPLALVYDMNTYYDYPTHSFPFDIPGVPKYHSFPFLDKEACSDGLMLTKINPDFMRGFSRYSYTGETRIEDGKTFYEYKYGIRKILLTEEEAVRTAGINIGAFLDEKPSFATTNYTVIIYPECMRNTVFSDMNPEWDAEIKIIAEDFDEAEYETDILLRRLYYDSSAIVSTENNESIRESSAATGEFLKVIAGWFVVLMSLIAAANIFNTISTNILLRRREIAALMSVGLSRKGLYKMMMLESLHCGIRSFAFSLPLSLIICILMHYYIKDYSLVDFSFRIPWLYFATAIAGVLVVVLISTLYSVTKLKKDNIIEALRSENI